MTDTAVELAPAAGVPAYSRGSSAEHEIRDALVGFLHRHAPSARVVHELVVGGCRADVGAVFRDRLILFEIKSERDVLKRLDEQVRQFSAAAHDTVIVAHEKFFDTATYQNGNRRIAWPHPLQSHCGRTPYVWAYPDPQWSPYGHRWALPRPSLRQPQACTFLDLLWRDELVTECFRSRISVTSRTPRWPMIEQMAWLMTGREIAEAVCRQLRQRSFPAADPAILEKAP
ncbi:hypothetical protein [Kaistia algarum]|uniref:hypothetical protein n=1 Tax=Kaistia algarum TaxID=2083279 RepID=UPI0010572A73|nr:hypothetical protein [Kaistia algarum]MCX5516259.1 hypothetical protein [Kaistia algarum]